MLDKFLLACIWLETKLERFFKWVFKEDFGRDIYFPYDETNYLKQDLDNEYMRSYDEAVVKYSKPCDDTGYDPDGTERISTAPHGEDGHICKNDSDVGDILTSGDIEKEDAAFYELIDPKGCRIEIYQDRKKEWRWRFFSANNKIIATSGEGYKRKGSLRKSLNIIREVIPFVPIEEV